jgi:hypothetical protein
MGIMGVAEVEAVVEVVGEGEGVGGGVVGMVRRRGNGHGKISTRRAVLITIEREDTTRRWRGQALVPSIWSTAIFLHRFKDRDIVVA